eukprot:1153467-Pelagomonas_calceolata.AAC.8
MCRCLNCSPLSPCHCSCTSADDGNDEGNADASALHSCLQAMKQGIDSVEGVEGVLYQVQISSSWDVIVKGRVGRAFECLRDSRGLTNLDRSTS